MFSHLELLSGGSNLRWGAAGFSFDADGGTVTLQVRNRASCDMPEPSSLLLTSERFRPPSSHPLIRCERSRLTPARCVAFLRLRSTPLTRARLSTRTAAASSASCARCVRWSHHLSFFLISPRLEQRRALGFSPPLVARLCVADDGRHPVRRQEPVEAITTLDYGLATDVLC